MNAVREDPKGVFFFTKKLKNMIYKQIKSAKK